MMHTLPVISSKCAKFSFISQGILRIEILEDSEIDLAESKEMHRLSKEITKGGKFVVLIDARANVEISKEAREWGSSPNALEKTVAQAILVSSLANRIMGNFIIQFHKPIAKTKLFSDENEAINWLKIQRKSF